MKAHVIEGGRIVNTIRVESLDILPNLIDASIGGTIGDLWDGTQVVPYTPTPDEMVARDAIAQYLADKLTVKQDGIVQTFITKTPAQVNDYIDAQVTDLASARNVMKLMARMLLLLARREFS